MVGQFSKPIDRISADVLPQPFGEAVKFITETMVLVARLDDWRQAHLYKHHVDQLTAQMHQFKATYLAAEKAKTEKVKPFVPVSPAPTTVLKQYKPTPQQPPVLRFFGLKDTSEALLTQADKETGWQRALYLKIVDRLEQLPRDTIVYQRETELPPKELLEVAVAAVMTWQLAYPDKAAKICAEAWDLQHHELAAQLAVVAEVSGSRSVKPQEFAALPFITAYPSQIARQYMEHASQINRSNPSKTRFLQDTAAALNRVSNAREITLLHPSAPLNEITAELQKKGMGSRRG